MTVSLKVMPHMGTQRTPRAYILRLQTNLQLMILILKRLCVCDPCVRTSNRNYYGWQQINKQILIQSSTRGLPIQRSQGSIINDILSHPTLREDHNDQKRESKRKWNLLSGYGTVNQSQIITDPYHGAFPKRSSRITRQASRRFYIRRFNCL